METKSRSLSFDMTNAGEALDAHLTVANKPGGLGVSLQTDGDIRIDVGGATMVMSRRSALEMAAMVRRAVEQWYVIDRSKGGRPAPVLKGLVLSRKESKHARSHTEEK